MRVARGRHGAGPPVGPPRRGRGRLLLPGWLLALRLLALRLLPLRLLARLLPWDLLAGSLPRWGHRPVSAGRAPPVVGHAHPLWRSVLRRRDEEFAGAYCE
jgi:hypothetical protein